MRSLFTLLLLLAGAVFSAMGLVMLRLSDPARQTQLLQQATRYLSQRTQAEISIAHAQIRVFRSVHLEGVLIKDLKKDTLLYAAQVDAGISLVRAAFGRLHLRSLQLQQGLIRLQRPGDQEGWNFQFLLDSFSKNNKSNGKGPQLRLGEVNLREMHFVLNDVPNNTLLNFKLPRLSLEGETIDLQRSQFMLRHLTLDRPDLHVIKLAGVDDTEPIADTGIVHLNTKPLRLRIHRFQLIDATFRYDDQDARHQPGRFDGLHQVYHDLNLRIINGALLYDRVEGTIEELRFREQSGFRLLALKGDAVVTPQEATLSNLQITTPYSSLADSFAFSYDNFHAFYDFNENVRMHLRLKNAAIGLADLAYFGSPLQLAAGQIVAAGVFSGTLSDFDAYQLKLQAGRLTRFTGQASFNGLPDIQQTFISIRTESLTTDADDLYRITGKQELAQRLAQAGIISFQGSFLGFPSDFVAYGTFSTNLGIIRSDLNMKLSGAPAIASYSGNLVTERFDIGRLLDQSQRLGTVAMNVQLKGSGLDLATVQARMTGRVDQLEFNGYSYSAISIDGLLNQRKFDGTLLVDDPNLQLDFSGLINLSDTLPAYRFTAQLKQANLDQLGFAEQPMSVQAALDLDLRGRSLDDLSGTLQAYDLTAQRRQQQVEVDSLFASISEGGRKTQRQFIVRSSALNAEISGRFALTHLGHDVLQVLNKYVPIVSSQQPPSGYTQDFSFSVTAKKISPVLRFFLPALNGLDYSRLEGRIQTATNRIEVSGTIPSLRYGSIDFGSVKLESRAPADSLYVLITSHQWRIGDTLRVAEPTMVARMGMRGSLVTLSAHSHDEHSRLYLPVALSTADEQLMFHVLPDHQLTLNQINWTLSPDNRIYYHDQRLLFDHFVLTSGFRLLEVQNINPRVRATNLRLRFHQIPLQDVPQLTRIGNWTFSGHVNGSAELINVFHDLRINANLTIFRFTVNQALVQEAKVIIDYVPEKDELVLQSRLLDSLYDVSISGSFFPKRRTQQLDLNLQITQSDLALAEALFFSDLISETSGRAKGRMRLYGSVQDPWLTGRVDVSGFRTTVDYLNASYTSPGFILRFRESFIDLGQLTLYDQYGDSARLSGQIPHTNLDDWQLEVKLQTNRFLVLNTTAADDSLFYGTAVVSGIITFSGSATAPEVVANVRTERGTRINIPITSSSYVGQNSFIEFRSMKANPGMTAAEPATPMASLSMAFNVDVTPDALFRIIFDEKTGDIIEANGSGNLRMEVVLPDVFNMYGRLQVEQGQYLFTQYNFFNKYFTLDPGGTIEWNGNPYEARLDLSAVYSTKASLDVLLADAATLSDQDRRELRQRQAVDLYLMLSGPLSAPEIRFDIRLAENTGASNAANLVLMRIRQDENELNKQVFGVLILGHFLPPGPDLGNTGIGAEVNNNLSEFLFNQLSYLASSIRSDVDLNVSYQTYEANINPADPADLVRRNELQVALTKRFLDDRLALDVGGNFDFGGSGVQQAPTGIAGDFAVDYKITPDGRIRARVFSKSDYDAIDERVKTRNGIGVKFSRDFNTLRELFKRKEEPVMTTDSLVAGRRSTAARRHARKESAY
ncbi:MAG: translocation/assembly module TamB domain-containing protein [Chitinophagales bacterium]|nr:translocation/assembly module TamB domain-containing protein [Chitinophagales bacterium]MDW8393752.1 translocation/assembly module TamB domain-containing protein [Chitinophagales bacterium]